MDLLEEAHTALPCTVERSHRRGCTLQLTTTWFQLVISEPYDSFIVPNINGRLSNAS